MTRCYKIKKKLTKTIHGDSYFKLEGIHVDVRVPFSIWLDAKPEEHFVSCKFQPGGMSYKVINLYSSNGSLLKRNKK